MPKSIFDRFRTPTAPTPTPEQVATADAQAKAEQSNWPWWKQYMTNAGEMLAGGATGLLGLSEPSQEERMKGLFQRSPYDIGSSIGNVGGATEGMAKAGLPMMGILGKEGKITHGTQRIFDYFNDKNNEVGDVLGWLSHGAENPRYSESYSSGGLKGLKSVDLYSNKPVSKNELSISGEKWYSKPEDVGKTVAPRTIPIQLHNKNTLDLVEPNADDISQALASLDDWEKRSLIQKFKEARSGMREGARTEAFLPTRHYDQLSDIPANEVPIRHVAEHLRMTPETFKKSPFDAIRYRDVGEKSWAFPPDVPAKTPWGVDVTSPPKELKVLKTDKPSGGTLEVHPSRWDDVGALSAQLKNNPDMKLTGEQIEKLYYDNKITGKQKYDLYKNNVMSSSDQIAGMKPVSKSWDELTNQEKINWKPGEGTYKHGGEKKTAEEWENIAKNESPGLNPYTVHPHSKQFDITKSKFKNEMEAQGLSPHSSDYLSTIIAKHGKQKFTPEELNKLNDTEMLTESEHQYMKQHHMIEPSAHDKEMEGLFSKEGTSKSNTEKQKLMDQMTSYGLSSDSADYLSGLVKINQFKKEKFTPEQINQLAKEHNLSPNEVNYLQHNHSVGKSLNQDEVDNLLDKHLGTKPNEPFKPGKSSIMEQIEKNTLHGKMTSEGHFIPDFKKHPNEWAHKQIELNKYSTTKINDMYANGSISKDEWNALHKALVTKAEEWLDKNKHLIKPGYTSTLFDEAMDKGEVSGKVWGAYLKMLEGKK